MGKEGREEEEEGVKEKKMKVIQLEAENEINFLLKNNVHG